MKVEFFEQLHAETPGFHRMKPNMLTILVGINKGTNRTDSMELWSIFKVRIITIDCDGLKEINELLYIMKIEKKGKDFNLY